MRAAPAVQATLGRDLAWAAFTRGLTALALAGLAAWAAQASGAPAAGVAPMAAAAALLGWVVVGPRLLAAPSGTLRWDGMVWSWQARDVSEAQTGAVAVMIDLGPWMLLRFVPAAGAGAAWLPLAQSACGPAWRALRTALYARGTAE